MNTTQATHTPERTPELLMQLEVAGARRANKVVVQFKRAGYSDYLISQASVMRNLCMKTARHYAAIARAQGGAL